MSSSATLDVFTKEIQHLKNEKIEISMAIVNPRFYMLMMQQGLVHKIKQIAFNGANIQQAYQIWEEVPIVFNDIIDDWYLIPKCNWYDQPFKGIDKLAVAEEL